LKETKNCLLGLGPRSWWHHPKNPSLLQLWHYPQKNPYPKLLNFF